MGAVMVVIGLEVGKLSLQVNVIPEQCMVKVFTANGSDKSLNEGMLAGRIGNAFDFIDIQDAKIRLPLVILE